MPDKDQSVKPDSAPEPAVTPGTPIAPLPGEDPEVPEVAQPESKSKSTKK
jgi:hypothetical protein